MTDSQTRRIRPRRNHRIPDGTTAAWLADATLAEEPLTYDEADRETLMIKIAELESKLSSALEQMIRRRANLAKDREAFDRLVAESVSANPTAVNWYDYPGPLSRRRVVAAAGIKTGVELSRIMERYRGRAKPTKAKRTATKRSRPTT